MNGSHLSIILIDRLYEEMAEMTGSGKSREIAAIAASLLCTGEFAIGSRLLEQMLREDPRFYVADGRAGLTHPPVPFNKRPISQIPFAVLDFETNGFSSNGRAIEIGVVCMKNGKETASFESLLNPGTHISAFVTRLTGICPEDLVGKPSFSQLWPKIRTLLVNRVLVAHNLPFDDRILRLELENLGVGSAPYSECLCTLRLARRVLPRDERKSLDVLADRFGLSFTSRHRALDDARVAGRLLFRLLDLASDDNRLDTWADLQGLLYGPLENRHN